jgi:hypothetical protein
MTSECARFVIEVHGCSAVRYSNRTVPRHIIAMTCMSLDNAPRSPGDARCLSRRNPFQAKEALDRTMRVGPGTRGTMGESRRTDGLEALPFDAPFLTSGTLFHDADVASGTCVVAHWLDGTTNAESQVVLSVAMNYSLMAFRRERCSWRTIGGSRLSEYARPRR